MVYKYKFIVLNVTIIPNFEGVSEMQKKYNSILFAGLLILLLISGIAGCNYISTKLGNKQLTLSNTDYSDMNNWVRFGGSKEVDIFVVYPTVLSGSDETYVPLHDNAMRESSMEWLNSVDSIISTYANVYVPLYRQVNRTTLFTLSASKCGSLMMKTPRDDIFAAFAYFLENVNKNERPFIIFGFSQGGKMVIELATVFLGNEKYSQYNKNHVVTYAIGMSVTQAQINKNPQLKFSQSADDYRVIVSWNTTAPSDIESDTYKGFATWTEGALVTNPVSWKTDEVPAGPTPFNVVINGPTKELRFVGNIVAFADKVRGLLILTSPDEGGYSDSFPGFLSRFHLGDIIFYYESIKQNVKDRIDAFKLNGQ